MAIFESDRVNSSSISKAISLAAKLSREKLVCRLFFTLIRNSSSQ